MGIKDRLIHAWNAFVGNTPKNDLGYGYTYRPDRTVLKRTTDRSIIMSIYNRIAMDVASVNIEHVRLDANKRYIDTITDGLNNCLTLSANIDQTGRSFIQDLTVSMFDEGCVAVVITDANVSPVNYNSYDIEAVRVGKITDWYPEHVRVNVYNDKTGKREDIVLPKHMVAIIENPFYLVMNSPNSTLQRLLRKLNMLDAIDDQVGSNKLNMIIQLPYVVKNPARKAQADQRREEIEKQLVESKYGIAYTDGTEKIVQLNRPLENKLLEEVKYLTSMLYSQLGMPQTVFDGTADEATMLNYNNRTIEPILSAITVEMTRKFLTKTARTQGQSIVFFRDPFKLVPVNQLAETVDKLTRNEVMTSNEVRQIIGLKPSNDPGADELRNKNLNESAPEAMAEQYPMYEDEGENQNDTY